MAFYKRTLLFKNNCCYPYMQFSIHLLIWLGTRATRMIWSHMVQGERQLRGLFFGFLSDFICVWLYCLANGSTMSSASTSFTHSRMPTLLILPFAQHNMWPTALHCFIVILSKFSLDCGHRQVVSTSLSLYNSLNSDLQLFVWLLHI